MAALTSLLVRDHVVSVHKIEEALQQQVLEGGEIDTVLLELGAAPEDVLSAYRAATFGLTPATRQEVMSAQGEALLALPKEVAEHFRLVPIALREQVLIVATSKPLPDAAVDELKKKLKLELEFCIATEVRVETALAVHYGIEISGRMRRLADELEKCEPGALPKVDPLGEGMGAQHERNIVDEFWATSPVKEPSDDARETTGNPSVPTQALSVSAPSASGETRDPLQQAWPSEGLGGLQTPPFSQATELPSDMIPGGFDERGTLRGIKPIAPLLSDSSPSSYSDSIQERNRSREERGLIGVGRMVGIGRPGQSLRAGQPASNDEPPVIHDQRQSLRASADHGSGQRGNSRHRGVMTPGVVDELLRSARDRDTILEVFFSFARQYFRCAALFAFRENRAFGMYGYGLDETKKIRAVSLPLDEGSYLLDVQRSLFGGVIDLSRRDVDAPLPNALDRLTGQPSALLPVCIRKRAVLCLYGDRSGELFALDEIAEIIELLPKVGRALESIIQARKFADIRFKRLSSKPPPPSSEGAPSDKTEHVPEKKSETDAGGRQSIERSPQSAPFVKPFSQAGKSRSHIHTLSGISSEHAPLGGGRSQPRKETLAEAIADKASDRLHSQFAGRGESAPVQAAQDAEVPREAEEKAGGREASEPESVASVKRFPNTLIEARRTGEPFTPNSAEGYRAEQEPHVDTKPAEANGGDRGLAVHAWPSADPDAGEAAQLQTKQRRPRLGGIVSDLLQRFRSSPSLRPKHSGYHEEPSEALKRAQMEPSVVVNLQDLTRELVDKLCSCAKDQEGPIIAALGRAGEEALPELVKRFPGPLWIKPRPTGVALPAGRDVSAVARALLSFGEEAINPVRELLSNPDKDAYYYALFLARDLACDALLEPVTRHLFDPDVDTRRAAWEVLWQFRGVAGFDKIASTLKDIISSPKCNIDERVVAVEALGGIRDCTGLRLLSSLLEGQDERLSEAAHKALVSITLQDLGSSERKWNTWIDANQSLHRVQWLIEGLMHSEESIRAAAGSEIAYLTQQYFGYQASSPKRDRERIQQKYREWWKANQAT